jgi:copper oxidase (laccase) domain-containing protein
VARIGVDPRCTVEDPELYSYRRDGVTGRLAAVIWIDPRQDGPTDPRTGRA